MTALIVIGVIVLLIVGVMLIPIGADVGYEGGQLHVSAKAAGILIQLIPKKPGAGDKPKKEKKPKRIKKKKEPPAPGGEEKPKKKLNLSFNADEILSLVRKVLSRFGRFGRAFRVDRFVLRYTAAGEDPYTVAQCYAWVNAALSSLAPLCARRFRVRDCQVQTEIDFTAEHMSLDFGLALTIRIGKIFGLVFSVLFAALGILIKNKFRLFREKRRAGREKAAQTDNGTETEKSREENGQETIQAEERMDSNG